VTAIFGGLRENCRKYFIFGGLGVATENYTLFLANFFYIQKPPKIDHMPPKISYFGRYIAYFRWLLAAENDLVSCNVVIVHYHQEKVVVF
jgi:hypothetical protein